MGVRVRARVMAGVIEPVIDDSRFAGLMKMVSMDCHDIS